MIAKEKQFFKISDIVYVGIFTSLMAICAWITIPATIPFTMQTLAVFLCVGLLGLKRSFFAVIAYITLGFMGVPVFSGFIGGPAVIFGATGGYIIGFIFISLISGFIINHLGNGSFIMPLAFLSGLLICYLFGTAWFIFFYTRNSGSISIITELSLCVFPYIIPDMLKIFLAVFLTKGIGKRIRL